LKAEERDERRRRLEVCNYSFWNLIDV
jgi:hypothetical protein